MTPLIILVGIVVSMFLLCFIAVFEIYSQGKEIEQYRRRCAALQAKLERDRKVLAELLRARSTT